MLLASGLPGQGDFMSVVDDAVEDGVGDGPLSDGVLIRLQRLAVLDGGGSWSRMCSIHCRAARTRSPR